MKGVGGRTIERNAAEGRNSHFHGDTVQQISISELICKDSVTSFTRSVEANSKFPQILRFNDLLSNAVSKSVPIPKNLGKPSIFKRVVFVINKNRTFGQVFGDIKGARGEPKLCVVSEKITPNYHALPHRYEVLDNYYREGDL